MTRWLALGLLAAALAAIAAVLFMQESASQPEATPPELQVADEVTAPPDALPAPDAATSRRPLEEAPPAGAQDAPANRPEPPSTPRVIGTCLAAEDRRALTGTRVRARDIRTGTWSYECSAGADGSFELVLDPPPSQRNQLYVSCEHEGRVSARLILENPFSAGEIRRVGEVLLPLGARVFGHVAGPQGEAISGATLALAVGSALSDPQGRFQFHEGIPHGSHQLHVRALGWLSTRVVIEVPLAQGLRIELAPARTIEGFVLDDSGQPIEGVDVFPDSARERRSSRSDARGRFSIANPTGEGEATKLYVLPGVTERWTSPSPIPWGARDVLVSLQRTLGFDLEVVDQKTGAPIERYAVHELPVGSRPEGTTLRHGGQHEGGKLRVAPVERGERRLWVVPEDSAFAPHEREPFVIADGAPVKLRIALERRPLLRVEVVDERGAPVPGARVSLVRSPLDRDLHPLEEPARDDAGLMRSKVALAVLLDEAQSDAKGEATLRSMPDRVQLMPPKGGLEPEAHPPLFARALAPGFAVGQVRVPFAPTGSRVRIALPRGAVLAGQVVPRRLIEEEKVAVFLASPGATMQPMTLMFTAGIALDAEGRFEVPDLPAGEVVLYARIGHRPLEQPVARAELRAGERSEVAVDLGAFAPARIDVLVRGARNMQLRFLATAGEPRSRRVFSQADGRLDESGALSGLSVPPGTYDVDLCESLEGSAGTSTKHCLLGTVTIVPGERRTFEYDYRPRRLTVRVTRENGTSPPARHTASLHEDPVVHEALFDAEGVLIYDPAPTRAFYLRVEGERHPKDGTSLPPPGSEPWEIELRLRKP